MNAARLKSARLSSDLAALGLFLLCALGCGGCFEVEDLWTLNPDGSGQVVRQVTLAPRGKTPEEWTRWGIERSAGVAAWSDYSSETLPDGRLRLRVTAHFADLGTLDFACGPQPYWTGSGEARRVVLSDHPPPAAASPPADASARAALVERRRSHLSRLLKAYGPARRATFRTTLRLPAAPQDAPGFERGEGGELRASLSLGRVEAELTPLLEDEAFLLERGERRLLGPRVNALVAGGSLEVSLAGELQPRFDYPAALAAARSGSEALLDRLGFDAVAGGRTLRVLESRVALLAYVRSDDRLPFHLETELEEFTPHLRLGLTLRLNGRPTAVTGLSLERAKALGGADLLDPALAAAATFEADEEDKTLLRLSLPLRYPAAPFLGLGEVRGQVQVTLASKTAPRALGFRSLAGGESTERAEIRDFTPDYFTLRCAGVAPSDVAKVRLVGPDGAEVEVEDLTREAWEDGVELVLFPGRELVEGEQLDVVLELYVDKRVVALPFRIRGVDPTGRTPK